jgi:hypothetical protein
MMQVAARPTNKYDGALERRSLQLRRWLHPAPRTCHDVQVMNPSDPQDRAVAERHAMVDAYNALLKRHRRILARLRGAAGAVFLAGLVVSIIGLTKLAGSSNSHAAANTGLVDLGGLLTVIAATALVVSLVLGFHWGSRAGVAPDWRPETVGLRRSRDIRAIKRRPPPFGVGGQRRMPTADKIVAARRQSSRDANP